MTGKGQQTRTYSTSLKVTSRRVGLDRGRMSHVSMDRGRRGPRPRLLRAIGAQARPKMSLGLQLSKNVGGRASLRFLYGIGMSTCLNPCSGASRSQSTPSLKTQRHKLAPRIGALTIEVHASSTQKLDASHPLHTKRLECVSRLAQGLHERSLEIRRWRAAPPPSTIPSAERLGLSNVPGRPC